MPLRVYSVLSNIDVAMMVIAESDQDAADIVKADYFPESEKGEEEGEFACYQATALPDDLILKIYAFGSDPEYASYAAKPPGQEEFTYMEDHEEEDGWFRAKSATEWVKDLGRGILAVDGYACETGYPSHLYRFLWAKSREVLKAVA